MEMRVVGSGTMMIDMLMIGRITMEMIKTGRDYHYWESVKGKLLEKLKPQLSSFEL